MSKYEIIKEAWNEHQVNFSLETGWAVTYVCNGIDDFSKEMQEYFDIEYMEQDIMRYRPKSLQGIENNNGWISINSEEDLPKEGTEVYFIFNGKFEKGTYQSKHFTRSKQNELIEWKLVSHYQLENIPELPIF